MKLILNKYFLLVCSSLVTSLLLCVGYTQYTNNKSSYIAIIKVYTPPIFGVLNSKYSNLEAVDLSLNLLIPTFYSNKSNDLCLPGKNMSGREIYLYKNLINASVLPNSSLIKLTLTSELEKTKAIECLTSISNDIKNYIAESANLLRQANLGAEISAHNFIYLSGAEKYCAQPLSTRSWNFDKLSPPPLYIFSELIAPIYEIEGGFHTYNLKIFFFSMLLFLVTGSLVFNRKNLLKVFENTNLFS
jgi:hypothetical protein